jgi:enoyl-CoA hydratase
VNTQVRGEGRIGVEVEAGVRTLVIDNPAARNAMTFAMWHGLKDAIIQAGEDADTRAVIIVGAGGKAFAAGTDIAEFRAFKSGADALAYEAMCEDILGTIERCPKPIVAALAGACTGGGAAIAAACDMRIAAANLRFGVPIARTIGNCVSANTLSRLAALIGQGRVLDLLFTARLIGADEALGAGFLSEVTTDFESLQARARELAGTLAGHAPLTLQATKEAFRRLRGLAQAAPSDDLLELCFMSRDFQAGVDAFLNGRDIQWTGS